MAIYATVTGLRNEHNKYERSLFKNVSFPFKAEILPSSYDRMVQVIKVDTGSVYFADHFKFKKNTND